jgi:hypothetical protein
MNTTIPTDPKVNAATLTSFAFDSAAIRSAPRGGFFEPPRTSGAAP